MKIVRRVILSLTVTCLTTGCTTQNPINSESVASYTASESASESLRFLNTQNQNDDEVPKFTEGYVRAGGSRLHYVSGGSGKLVVFYHGFPSYWYIWKHQLRDLAKDYRVVAFDGLGTNLSGKPTEVSEYAVSNLSAQLREAIEKLNGHDPYALVGHDWGGALAWAYAQTNPQGLEKLIVLNAPPYNLFLELLRSNAEQRKASQYVERLKSTQGEKRLKENNALGFWKAGGYEKFVARGLISTAEGELFKTAMARPGSVTGGINWYRANLPLPHTINTDDFWPSQSANTSVDSMLIWGETDKTFVPAFLQQLPNYTKQLQIEILPGVGHTPQLEAPERVNKLIRSFIETL
jgi:pimeloyl-ACP methyl ester carboxylesterase